MMFKHYINQSELAEILGLSMSEVSIMLKHELAPEEQKNIIEEIKAWVEAQEEEGA
jgi:predicted transcriptional regulator